MLSASRRDVLGWIAAVISAVISCFWAFWGIIENFHEGWYLGGLEENLLLMFAQYLSPLLAFLLLAMAAHFWPRVGAVLHAVAGFVIVVFVVSTPAARTFILLPMVTLGILYIVGNPIPHGKALALNLGTPVLVLVVFGISPWLTVMHRSDDGDRGTRVVQGNNVRLQWAPLGPGWPDRGVSWGEARRRCSHLIGDGSALADTEVNIWRLPTVSEVVRSLTRGGVNAGGNWNDSTARTSYSMTPDKEIPLWNPRTMVISWWTFTETDSSHAYRVVYNGQVHALSKKLAMGSLGFRAVRYE